MPAHLIVLLRDHASCAVRVVEGISFTSQGTPAAENANRTRSIPLLDSVIATG